MFRDLVGVDLPGEVVIRNSCGATISNLAHSLTGWTTGK
jgi:hypothetical protein